MSVTRQKIAYWILLSIGVILLILQTRKYYLNTLTLSLGEVILTGVAVSLVISPRTILNTLTKFISSKSK